MSPSRATMTALQYWNKSVGGWKGSITLSGHTELTQTQIYIYSRASTFRRGRCTWNALSFLWYTQIWQTCSRISPFTSSPQWEWEWGEYVWHGNCSCRRHATGPRQYSIQFVTLVSKSGACERFTVICLLYHNKGKNTLASIFKDLRQCLQMAAIRFGLTLFNPKLITSNNELEYPVQILLYGCHFASKVGTWHWNKNVSRARFIRLSKMLTKKICVQGLSQHRMSQWSGTSWAESMLMCNQWTLDQFFSARVSCVYASLSDDPNEILWAVVQRLHWCRAHMGLHHVCRRHARDLSGTAWGWRLLSGEWHNSSHVQTGNVAGEELGGWQDWRGRIHSTFQSLCT